MSFQLAKAYVEFSQKGMGGLLGGIGGLASKLKSLVSPMGLVTSGLAALGAGAGVGGILKLYATQEEAEKRLEQVVRATGAAAGFSAAELKKMAGDLQEVTRFGDETTLQAQAMLLTFKSLKGDIFRDTLETAMDLSTVFGQDINGSVAQLGKALEDPLRGLTALRRVGVSFSKQQEDTIKRLVETNQLAKAQRLILDAIAGQVGGSARAAANTFAGQWEQAKNAVGDVFEEIGKILVDTFDLTALAGSIRSLAGTFQEYAPQIKATLEPVVAWMGSAFGSVADWIGGKFSALTAWVKSLWAEWGDVVWAYVDMAMAYYRMLFGVVSEVFTQLWDFYLAVFGWMGETLSSFFGDANGQFKTGVIGWLQTVEFFFENWKLYLQIGWQEFLRFVMNVPAYFSAAVTNMGNLISWFAGNWREIFLTSADYILTVMSNLGQNIRDLWQSVKDFISGGGWTFEATDLAKGFHNSIKKMPEFVKAAVHESTPELDKLYKELDQRRVEFYAEKNKGPEAAAEETAAATGGGAAPGATGKPAAAATGGGDKFKFYGLAAFADQMQQQAAKQAESRQAMDLQRQQADATNRLVDAATSGGLKVTVTNPGDLQPAY